METKTLSYNELQAKARVYASLIDQAEKEIKKADAAANDAIDACPLDVEFGDFPAYLEARVLREYWSNTKSSLEITAIKEALIVDEVFYITVQAEDKNGMSKYEADKELLDAKMSPSQAKALRSELSFACMCKAAGTKIKITLTQYGGFIGCTTEPESGDAIRDLLDYKHCTISRRGKRS